MNFEQEQLDAMEEMGASVDALHETMKKARPPVVNVSVPIQPTPQVTVKPEIKVEVPEAPAPKVHFVHKPVAYECKVTSRDGNGDIKTFTLTPIE